MATAIVPPVILFTFINGGSTIIAAIVAAVMFKEKLTFQSGVGVVLGIPNSNGILKHAVYAMKQNIGVDECNIWGDYYYMEALMRYTNPKWDSYWG